MSFITFGSVLALGTIATTLWNRYKDDQNVHARIRDIPSRVKQLYEEGSSISEIANSIVMEPAVPLTHIERAALIHPETGVQQDVTIEFRDYIGAAMEGEDGVVERKRADAAMTLGGVMGTRDHHIYIVYFRHSARYKALYQADDFRFPPYTESEVYAGRARGINYVKNAKLHRMGKGTKEEIIDITRAMRSWSGPLGNFYVDAESSGVSVPTDFVIANLSPIPIEDVWCLTMTDQNNETQFIIPTVNSIIRWDT